MQISIGYKYFRLVAVTTIFLSALVAHRAQAAKVALTPVAPIASAPVSEGFQLSVRAERERLEVGERVVFFLTLKNVGKESGSFVESSPQLDFTVAAKRVWTDNEKPEDGKDVPATAFSSDPLRTVGNRSWISIKSGQSVTYKLVVNRLIDMSRTGTYFITVSTTVLKLSVKEDLQKQKVAQSEGKTIPAVSPFSLLNSNVVRVKVVETDSDIPY